MASSENVLVFNLDCEGQKLTIELQDFDTVEDLKNYVQSLYDIPINQQHIEGWTIEPDCDKGVLQQYVLPFEETNLKISRKDSMKKRPDVKILSDEGNYSKTSETEAAKSCVRKTARYFILSQTTLEVRDLRTLMSGIGEKMLLLYFHNDQEEFSKTFCRSLAQTAMKTALKQFCILGWDVGESKYHEALVKVLSENDLQGLVCLVESKASAVIWLQTVNGSVPEVVLCLMGEMTGREILECLEKAQSTSSESPPSEAGTSETDAVKSCIKKTAKFGLAVKFETKELKQLQSESCISKKTLLLFLYNEQDQFSKTFCEILTDTRFRQILENFHILGWDVGEAKYHNVLSNTLSSCNLPNLICLIESEVSAVVGLRNIDEAFVTIFCLNGDVSHSEILYKLEVQPALENDESGESSLSEIDAAKSCVRKLARYLISSNIKFETRKLETLLVESCLNPLVHRKTLMIYLHNEEDEFSKTFSRNLMEMSIKRILADFCILGWDVSNTDYHEALLRTLDAHKLGALNTLIEARISALICFQNIDGFIVPLCYLNGAISDVELLEELQQAQTLSKIDAEHQNNMQNDNENYDINSTRYQQIMADMLGDRDYDLIDFDQREVLEKKIGFALYGPPQDEKEEYKPEQRKKIEKLRDVIMAESNEVAQYLDQVEISFIYNCVEPLPEEKIQKAKKDVNYNPNTDLMPIPLFVLRKCRISSHPCRIFIDETGRVYSSWQDYKENNKLHECIMVLPLNARYQVNGNEEVLLEKLPSPACSAAQQALRVADAANTGVGLATGGVFIAAALTPVLPALLVTAAVAGAATGVYSIARSATHLLDKSKHKESVSFADSEARGAYLNILAGSLGFVGTGANMVVAQLASNGANISKGAIYTVNTLNVVNLGASGASVINNGVDVFYQWYYEDRTPSLLTIVQLSSSVLFFGNALYNYKTAGNVIEESQARTLKEYQDSLRSNRHRKMFDKMTKETIRQNDGNVNAGRAEVIKTVRNIQNRDEVFASLTRHNKQMNRNGVRFSASNGQIQLNGQNVDMGTFINMNKNDVNTFLGKLPMKPNVTQADIRSMGKVYTVNNFSNTMAMPDMNSILSYSVKLIGFLQGDVQSKIISALSTLLSTIPTHFKQVLISLFPDNESRYANLLDAVVQFFAAQAQELDTQYERWKATNNPDYYNPLFVFVDTDEQRKCKKFLEDVVRACFSEGQMKEEALTNLLKYFYAWITEKLVDKEEENDRERKRAAHSSSVTKNYVKCDVCDGYYYSNAT